MKSLLSWGAFQIVAPCHSRAGGNPIIIRTLLHEIPACAGMTGIATVLRQIEIHPFRGGVFQTVTPAFIISSAFTRASTSVCM